MTEKSIDSKMMKVPSSLVVLITFIGLVAAVGPDGTDEASSSRHTEKDPKLPLQGEVFGSEPWRELHNRIFGPSEAKVGHEKVLSDLLELNGLYKHLNSPIHESRHSVIKRLLTYAEPGECATKTFENYIKEQDYFKRFEKTVGSYLNWAMERDLASCLDTFERQILSREHSIEDDAQFKERNHDESGEDRLNLLLVEVKKLLGPEKQASLYSLDEVALDVILLGVLNHLKQITSLPLKTTTAAAISVGHDREQLIIKNVFDKKELQGKRGKKALEDLFDREVLIPCINFWNAMLDPLLTMKYYLINRDTRAILDSNLNEQVRVIMAKVQICRPIMKDFYGVVKRIRDLALFPSGKPSRLDSFRKTAGKLLVLPRKH